jgi:hypothetical protein
VKSEGLATLLKIGRGGIGGFEMSLWLRCRKYSLEDPASGQGERDARFGSFGVPTFGGNCKKSTRRPQEVHCSMERQGLLLPVFVSARANLFLYQSVYMLTELTARSAFHIASNVYM